MLTALKGGDIDLSLALDPAVLGTAVDDPSLTVIETGAGTSLTISFDVTQPPFDNLKVRQAMKALVDREAMLNTALLGIGEMGNDNPVPPSWPSAYTSEIKKQDVELAKKLLAEAGFADGLDIDLYTSDALPGQLMLTQVFQQMAADAGRQRQCPGHAGRGLLGRHLDAASRPSPPAGRSGRRRWASRSPMPRRAAGTRPNGAIREIPGPAEQGQDRDRSGETGPAPEGRPEAAERGRRRHHPALHPSGRRPARRTVPATSRMPRTSTSTTQQVVCN